MKLNKFNPNGNDDGRHMIEHGLLLMLVIAIIMYLVAILNPSIPHPSPLNDNEGSGMASPLFERVVTPKTIEYRFLSQLPSAQRVQDRFILIEAVEEKAREFGSGVSLKGGAL